MLYLEFDLFILGNEALMLRLWARADGRLKGCNDAFIGVLLVLSDLYLAKENY